MTDPSGGAPGLAELSRLVRDVLHRFESLATKLETQFINKDVFNLYTTGVARELEQLVARMNSADQALTKGLADTVGAEKERNEQLGKRDDQLERRLAEVEGNIRWIVRLVIAAVVMFVLAAVGISARAGGGG